MRLTFIYPIYPTQEQETTLERWLDHLCDLQNSARHDRLVASETEGAFVSLSDQQTLLTTAREKYDDFREVPQDFQNHALRRNDKAFTAFRKRCKENAEKKGYPRHKKRVRSLTAKQRTTRAGIVKQKGCSENTPKTSLERKKVASVGRNKNTNSLYTMSEQQTNAKTLLENSFTNFTTIRKIMCWSPRI